MHEPGSRRDPVPRCAALPGTAACSRSWRWELAARRAQVAGRQWCPFTGLRSRSPRRLPGGAGSSQTLLSPARRLPRASGGPGSKGTPTGARCGSKLPCGAPASGRRGRALGSAGPGLGRGWSHQTATPGGWRGGVGGGELEWEERLPRPPASPTFHSGFTLARGRGEGAYSASIPVGQIKIIIINTSNPSLYCLCHIRATSIAVCPHQTSQGRRATAESWRHLLLPMVLLNP